MKSKYVIIVIVVFLGVFLNVSAQQELSNKSFYYYKDAKFYLQVDYSRVSVISKGKFDKINSKTISNRSFRIENERKSYMRHNIILIDETSKIAQNEEIFMTELEFSETLKQSDYYDFIKQNSKENNIVKIVPTYVVLDQKLGVSNNFYVKLFKKEDQKFLFELAEKHSIRVLGYNEFMPLWFTLSCDRESPFNAVDAANLFYETGLFDNAEPELLYHKLYMSEDQYFINQWGLKNIGQHCNASNIDINIERAWNITTGSPDIRVAVFDHGIQMDHPDLMKNIYGIGYDATTNTSPAQVRGSHGTSCAGIIGAEQNNIIGISGVAPNSKLMSISISLRLSDTPQQLANGFNWAWQNGADVISNSWGGYAPSNIIDDAIINALSQGRNGKGAIVVFASGNENNTAIRYPGNNNPDILVVGAISPNGERKTPNSCDGETKWGSNYGTALDIVAPGVLIPTTTLNGSYKTDFDGTSAATPHVAGVAALILSINPSLTQKQVANIIESTARKVGTYTYVNTAGRHNGLWHEEMGYGLVDAYAAVQMAKLLGDFTRAHSGDTITVPSGAHTLTANLTVPDSVENVVLRLQSGTELHFTDGGSEIWVGSTGKIIGADNVTLSHQIIQYNTPYPREPLPEDNVIGLFGNMCDALRHGENGRTTKVGPGTYNFNYVGDEGLIGVLHQEREKSSIIRLGFDDSTPGCSYPVPDIRSGATTLISGVRIEMNGALYTASSRHNPVLTVFEDGLSIFNDCIFEAIYPTSASKDVIAIQLGAENYPLKGRVEFNNCVFRNFNTGVLVNDPIYPEQSPVFKNTIFDNNTTDIRYSRESNALCGLEASQLKTLQIVDKRFTGEFEIKNRVAASCKTMGLAKSIMSVSDPGFVDPYISDYRLTGTSPLVAAGENYEDIGAYRMNAVFTFSTFLDGRVEFGNGRAVQFENGVLTANTIGDAVAFRFAYTLNMRPVYELTFMGSFVNKPSMVTVWKNGKASIPSLPSEYVVWDAKLNEVRFAKLYRAELPSLDKVSRSAVPDVVAPSSVSGINIVDESGDVVLTWDSNIELDVARYKIFRAGAASPDIITQIASLPANFTEYRDAMQVKSDNIYSIVAYDSTGNMSAPLGGNKLYDFSGFNESIRDTLRVTPDGITIQVHNPDYLYGAMITVRNRGHNDSLIVEWYGVNEQHYGNCENRMAELLGNGAQVNNIASSKRGNGAVLFNVRSASNETYLIDIEIYNWRNGQGCR